MRHELTSEQARAIAFLRGRHPRAELLVHRRPWGVMVEARRDGRALELLRADYYGRCETEHAVPRAA
ncbi:MAG TPA: hypothetical protein PKB03_08670 [Baekduia sp.]|nr:hypothetical protein [Baekduia sp.]